MSLSVMWHCVVHDCLLGLMMWPHCACHVGTCCAHCDQWTGALCQCVEILEDTWLHVMLSKKWSQEKSYKVRGQSDMCHTSVIFTPAFPWHHMGGKFSCRLVSTLSYLLYTCLCQEFLNSSSFSDMLTLNAVWTTSSRKLQFVQVHWI